MRRPGSPATTPTVARRWWCAGSSLERVFRYEDTEGEPLPEAPEVGYATGDTPDDAWDTLAALVTGHGFRLTAEPEPGDTRGHTDYTEPDRQHRPRLSDWRSGCTSSCTSWATSGAGTSSDGRSRGRSGRPRPSRSRSSSARVLGLDVGDPAAIYVGGWTDGDPDTITAAQAAIHQAARAILADLNTVEQTTERVFA